MPKELTQRRKWDESRGGEESKTEEAPELQEKPAGVLVSFFVRLRTGQKYFLHLGRAIFGGEQTRLGIDPFHCDTRRRAKILRGGARLELAKDAAPDGERGGRSREAHFTFLI